MFHLRTHALGAVIAGALLAAQPASAATYVFDVTINSFAAHVTPGYYPGATLTYLETHTPPFTFQMAFTPTGSFAETSYGSYIVGDADGAATPTPMDDDLFAASHLPAGPLGYHLSVGENLVGVYGVGFETDPNAYYVETPTDVSRLYIALRGGIETPLFGPMGGYDPGKVDQMLRTIGDFTFEATAEHYTHSGDFEPIDWDLSGYLGTATYRPDLSAIPEPAAWALMIGGFGLAGAALRRRRREGVGAA